MMKGKSGIKLDPVRERKDGRRGGLEGDMGVLLARREVACGSGATGAKWAPWRSAVRERIE